MGETDSGQTVAARLMIDTGAPYCLVADYIADELGLVPSGMRDVLGVHGEPKACPVYEMSIHIGMDDQPPSAVFTAEVVALDDRGDDAVHGLLGRDFLARFRLDYDGPAGTFTLHAADSSTSLAAAQKVAKKPRPKAARRR